MKKKEVQYDAIRIKCWNEALHCYGTYYLYNKKATSKKRYLTGLSLLGVLVPASVGGIITTYNIISPDILNILFFISGTLSLIQFIFSIISFVLKWDDQYSYYLESSHDNFVLSEEFSKLFKEYSPNFEKSLFKQLKIESEKLEIRNSFRTSNDSKYPFTEKENREGMRYALRYFKRKCEGCKIVPKDMISTNCPVCGNF